MPLYLSGSHNEYVFFNPELNESIVLYRRILDQEHVDQENQAAIPNLDLKTTTVIPKSEDEYDSTGALSFVVAVIIVYGISMFLIVATLIRRKSATKSLDGQVANYVKELEAARVQAKMESVLRMRLRWPGNFIQFGVCESDDGDDNDDDDDNSSQSDDSDSSSSCTIIPATTCQLTDAQAHYMESKDTDPPRSRSLQVTAIPSRLRRSRRHGTVRKSLRRDSRMRRSRRERPWIMDHDSDSSYVELPATTLQNKFQNIKHKTRFSYLKEVNHNNRRSDENMMHISENDVIKNDHVEIDMDEYDISPSSPVSIDVKCINGSNEIIKKGGQKVVIKIFEDDTNFALAPADHEQDQSVNYSLITSQSEPNLTPFSDTTTCKNSLIDNTAQSLIVLPNGTSHCC